MVAENETRQLLQNCLSKMKIIKIIIKTPVLQEIESSVYAICLVPVNLPQKSEFNFPLVPILRS